MMFLYAKKSALKYSKKSGWKTHIYSICKPLLEVTSCNVHAGSCLAWVSVCHHQQTKLTLVLTYGEPSEMAT